MVNQFEMAMKKKVDARHYADWKKKLGDAIRLPPDFNIDSVKIIPYFNRHCGSNQCIYDLKTLEKCYIEFNELEDPFVPEEEFVCNYCGNKVKFGEFFTNKELERDVRNEINSQANSLHELGSQQEADEEGDEEDDEGDSEDEEEDGESGGNQSDRTSKQDFESKSASSMKSTDETDIDFARDVPDTSAYNNIEVEEYSYIIDTPKREKIFRIEGERLMFSTSHSVKIAMSEFAKVVRGKELNNPLYDVILFEYWRAIYVKTMHRKLPLYYYQMEGDNPKQFKLKVRDATSRRVTKDDIKNDEMGIFVISIKKQVNLFVYDYNTERLTYISCDRKEHQEDEYSEGVLKQKAELFQRFNRMKFKDDMIDVAEHVNMYLEINNNITRKVFAHYYIAQQELKLPANKLSNFFDLILWILFKLNLKSKEELSEIAAVDAQDYPGHEEGAEREHSGRLHTRDSIDGGKGIEGPDPEEIKNFQNFYALLWYYYYYDRKRYKQIWKEYEKKFSASILQNAGMDPDLLDIDLQSVQPKGLLDDESSESTARKSRRIRKPTTPSDQVKTAQSFKHSIPLPPQEVRDFVVEDPPKKNALSLAVSPKSVQLPAIKQSFKELSAATGQQSKRGVMQMESLPPVKSQAMSMQRLAKPTTRRQDFDPEESFLKRLADDEDRIMKIHHNNVKQFPHLYEESSEKEKKQKPISRDAVVDQGMNVVSKSELEEFEKSGDMAEGLLNYFINYLRGKQEKMDSNLLDRYNLRTFFFTTELYRLFISDLSKKFFLTKYERVKSMTRAYSKPNKTIFESFQKIAVPVIEINNGIESFKLVIIDCLKKELILYDPLGGLVGKGEEPKDNKHLLAIASYVEQEYFDKAQTDADVHKTWIFTKADCTTTEDIRHSGLFTAYYLYILAKGMKQPFFRGKELNSFIAKIVSTVRKRQL